MALVFAKKQIIFAIAKMMDEYDVSDVDFVFSNSKPNFVDDGIKYEIMTIYKPDFRDLELEISTIPSYSFCLKDFTFTAENTTRLNTLVHFFKIVYNKLVGVYGIEDYRDELKDAESALTYYTDLAENEISA